MQRHELHLDVHRNSFLSLFPGMLMAGRAAFAAPKSNCPPLTIKNGGKMKSLKLCLAVIIFTALAAFTSCKKDDAVAPANAAHQTKMMDGDGQTPPQPPPPPNP
jgi:hypothetical protein